MTGIYDCTLFDPTCGPSPLPEWTLPVMLIVVLTAFGYAVIYHSTDEEIDEDQHPFIR